MAYISIDGDDIGRRVTARHLANDAAGLGAVVLMVHQKVKQVEHLLVGAGYNVIFCAADGVVAYNGEVEERDTAALFPAIEAIGGGEISFSAGVGQSLQEAYVALLAAKSNGKARVCIFSEIG